jgi:polygalacturonase
MVNVLDHGAKGDGHTDDTEAFRRAAEEAAKLGAHVRVPAGTYRATEIALPRG